MRIKILIFFIAVFILLPLLYGQNEVSSKENNYLFEFYYSLENIENIDIDKSRVGSHYLGKDIAIKEIKVQKLYTYTIKGSPTSPGTKTNVTKPEIFYSVKKANRYLKKALRKNKILEKEAKSKYNNILDIAITVYDKNTKELEKYFSQYRKKEKIFLAFQKIKLIKQ